MPSTGRIPQILLVEDSEDDAYFFLRISARTGIKTEIKHVSNGLAAIDALKACLTDQTPQAPAPDLMFLDLKLPHVDGFEVLSWVQKQTALPPLKIVVLSGSEDSGDVRKARALGAFACYAKPLEAGQFRGILATCGLTPPAASAPGTKPVE